MAAELKKKEKAGVPLWVVTFADLMTLLMCFFVLLLAFSEMDVAKFKQLSGSMRDAFGVQAEIEVRTIPKGTSIVAKEFSPGRPDPSAPNQLRQFTIDSNKNTLDALNREFNEIKATREHARRLRMALKPEISKGSVLIETEGMKIIIRILENASFDSGLAELREGFRPALEKIGRLIDDSSGEITISGHTDNVPIANVRFRSNWELSTSRAVTVAHELFKIASIDPTQVIVTGHADTRPVAANDSDEGRANNRRVDIAIVRGKEIDKYRSMSIAAVADQEQAEAEAESDSVNEGVLQP